MSLWVSPVLWHLRWLTVSGVYRNWLERQIRLGNVQGKDRERLRQKRRNVSDYWNYALCIIAIVAWLWSAYPAWILWLLALWRL